MTKETKEILQVLFYKYARTSSLNNMRYLNEADLLELAEDESFPVDKPVGVPKPNQLNEQTLWQTCPKCNGQGWMSKPSWITGDTNEWTSTSAMHVCDICWGAKIIQTPKSL